MQVRGAKRSIYVVSRRRNVVLIVGSYTRTRLRLAKGGTFWSKGDVCIMLTTK